MVDFWRWLIRKPFRLGFVSGSVTRVGRGLLGMLEFRVLECWNECGLLALEEVRFANGSTLSLKALPTQALGRTGWLLPWGRGRFGRGGVAMDFWLGMKFALRTVGPPILAFPPFARSIEKGKGTRGIARVLSTGMVERMWTFGVCGSSLRERFDPLLGGSPYAGFRENRLVVTLGRWSNWACWNECRLLAFEDPQAFQARFLDLARLPG